VVLDEIPIFIRWCDQKVTSRGRTVGISEQYSILIFELITLGVRGFVVFEVVKKMVVN
jgi:hypothetical protein